MLENLASFDAENEPCIFKERPKQMYASWFKKRKIEKKTHIHSVEADWKRAGPLTSRNLSLLSLNLLSSLPSFFLFLCLISSNPPITVMSGWERGRGGGRERLCVTGRIDGGGTKVGGNGRRRFIIAFYLLECQSSTDPVLIGRWSLTAGTKCRDLRCSLLSFWLREGWCGGKWACALKWKCQSEGTLIQRTFFCSSEGRKLYATVLDYEERRTTPHGLFKQSIWLLSSFMACQLMGLKWHMLILNIPIVFHTMRSVYVQIMRLRSSFLKILWM